jgi:hypothetical protein
MANPVIISCPKGEFTKSDGVSPKTGVQYRQTYRDTGDPAPTERYESVKVLEKGMPINSNIDIDVYIWCDNDDGSIRVDLA